MGPLKSRPPHSSTSPAGSCTAAAYWRAVGMVPLHLHDPWGGALSSQSLATPTWSLYPPQTSSAPSCNTSGQKAARVVPSVGPVDQGAAASSDSSAQLTARAAYCS